CGHEDVQKNIKRIKRDPVGKLQRVGFCGIHVISHNFFSQTNRYGCFSIVDSYLDLIESGQIIRGYSVNESYWQDIGKIDTLRTIHRDLKSRQISLEDLTAGGV
ncbi:MAG: hypothetical protein SCK70_14260, partial [bacterium]|nr:hypothetical protein [bacterium]